MQHFFVKPEQVEGDLIRIQGTDVNHIKNVLRMKLGEELEINDGNNIKYVGSIQAMDGSEVLVSIKKKTNSNTELSSEIFLFQGLPKGDKMELIVQKAVELGVTELIPVSMKRCVVKLDAKKQDKKVERWSGIATSAAKQAARGIVPKVSNVMTYKEALYYASKLNHVLVPYELAEGMKETKQIIESIKPGESIGVFIGPEGGFDIEEIQMAMELGMKPITLGRRILRTETAGLTTLSILMFHLEDVAD